MRTLLLQIHLYAGLLCSSYLVIFGISSLNYNHHFGEAISGDESHWSDNCRCGPSSRTATAPLPLGRAWK